MIVDGEPWTRIPSKEGAFAVVSLAAKAVFPEAELSAWLDVLDLFLYPQQLATSTRGRLSTA